MNSGKKGLDSATKFELLKSIKDQIDSFDHKAEILLAVIGVLFGLSFTILTSLDQISPQIKESSQFVVFLVFVFLFGLSSVVSVVLTLLVVFPRKKEDETFDVFYYYDISRDHEKCKTLLDALDDSDQSLDHQILMNADVCAKKHDSFVRSVLSLIPFALFLSLELAFFVTLVVLSKPVA